MTSRDDLITFTTRLGQAPDEDLEAEERAAIYVRRELSELIAADGRVSAVPVASPDGTRGVDAAAVGVLLVQIAPLLPVLVETFTLLKGWAGRKRGRTVRIVDQHGAEIELTELSQQDQHALVEAWIAGTARS